MVDLNWNPTTRQLRQFGAAALLLAPVAAWMLTGAHRPSDWTTTQQTIVGATTAIGAVLAALSWIAPAVVRPVFVALSVAAFPIGLVVSEAMLLLMFALVFTPVALLFRIIKRDALNRAIDRSAPTYWQAKSQPADVTSYFRQS